MRVPTTCPCCGAYSLTRADETSRLLLVCDVLVVKALERVGNRIVRSRRSRFAELDARRLPLHEAHTVWPDPAEVTAAGLEELTGKGLAGAWDVIPVLLSTHSALAVGVDPCDVVCVLDEYVRDLVLAREAHTPGELAYRLGARLGLDLPIGVGP